MADFISQFTGTQIDNGIDRALNPDATPTQGSDALIESGGVFAAINTAALSSAPAILNTASGAVCSFSDGSASPMRSVIAQIVASQAGSGTPYPAGGGKNKFDIGTSSDDWYGQVSITPNVDAQTVSLVTAAQGGTYAYRKNAIPSGTYTLSYDEITTTGNAKRVFIRCFDADGNNISNTVSITDFAYNQFFGGLFYQGIPKSFTVPNTVDHFWVGLGCNANTAGVTVTFGHIQLEEGSTATAYAPYSNIRPISGYTGVNVPRTGANVWDEQWEAGTYDSAASTVIKTVPYNHIRSKNPISVKPNTTYYFESTGKNVHLIVADAAGNVLFRTITLNNGTFTTPDNGVFVYFNMAQAYGYTYGNDLSINYPSSDTAYHAYAGEVFNVSWQDEAGTVYYGHIDIVSGVLVSTHTKNVLTNYTDTYIAAYNYGNTHGIAFQYALGPTALRAAGACNMSTVIQTTTPATPLSHYMWLGVNTRHIYWIGALDILGLSTVSDFVTWLRQNDLYVIQPLATPQTYQLTPQEVASLLGANTLWNDTNGDTSAEYRADTKLYIQSLSASMRPQMAIAP